MESEEEKDSAETRRALRERGGKFAPNVEGECGTAACKRKTALMNSKRQASVNGKGFETDSILTFPEFVAGEVAETVVGSVFVGFAERRVIENLFDEFVDGEAIVEDHHADVDEFGGVFADDADTKELLAGAGKDELEHACGVSGDVASGVVFVESAANDVVNFLFLAGFFGLAGSGNFRNRVNAHGEQRGNTLFVLQSKSVADGDAALLHGSGGQCGETDDIAGGINMRNSRTVVFVHGDITAIIDSQAGFFESEAIDSGATAGSEECRIGFESFAALHRHAHATGGIFCLNGALVKQVMHAKSGEAVAKAIGNLIVEKGEKTIAPVNEGDVNTEGLED